MTIVSGKTSAAIAIFLVLTIAITPVVVPSASAHDPAWQFPTHAYITAVPNIVGTGQTVVV